jgi:GT2 family glycosyltransferase
MENMSKQIDLSIILISSKKDYLFDCLKSIKKNSAEVSPEIILIDNASQDRLGEDVKKEFPEIKVIRREENGGFGENSNLGMKEAHGRYVLLLNDDTKVVSKNIFKEMVGYMDEHPKVGISSCALVNPDGKTYQGSGGSFPSLAKVFAWMTFIDDIPGVDTLIKPYHPLHGWSPLYKGESYFKKAHKQDWVTGAFFLMRKKAMDEVGFFDEDFFLYVEEVDLSYRFAEAGWEVWYLPQWKILHYGSVTIGGERATVYELQNTKLFYRKHYPGWQMPVLTLILKTGCLIRMFVFGIFKGFGVSKIYAKAFSSI